MRFNATALTATGHRSNNQDAYLLNDSTGLFAVADGMGGYMGGEVASQLALEVLDAFIEDVVYDPDRTCPASWDMRLTAAQNALEQGIVTAHNEVVAARRGAYGQMGTTVVALYVLSDIDLAVGHVGDSRAYRLRDGAIEALTRDHSLVEQLRKVGMIAEDGEGPPGMQHIVTAALGVGGFDRPTLALARPVPGDRYLLCSDGLSGVLEDAELAEIMSHESAAAVVESLVHSALAAGSRDNITVLLLDVLSEQQLHLSP